MRLEWVNKRTFFYLAEYLKIPTWTPRYSCRPKHKEQKLVSQNCRVHFKPRFSELERGLKIALVSPCLVLDSPPPGRVSRKPSWCCECCQGVRTRWVTVWTPFQSTSWFLNFPLVAAHFLSFGFLWGGKTEVWRSPGMLFLFLLLCIPLDLHVWWWGEGTRTGYVVQPLWKAV